MRDHLSARSSLLGTMFCAVAGASFLLSAPALRAQCDDSDSIDCQLQQTAPLPSPIQSPASPTELSMDAPSDQGSPQPDHSSEASADKSLPGGSNFTEQASRGKRSAGQQGGRSLPSAPPTEFQLFVAATTGHMLPIYGAGLFSQRAAAFGLIDKAPAPENMVVGPGDELHIRIWGQVNFSANLRVSREGEIYLPKAGAVHVAGLEFSAVAGHLRAALERVYRNFELSVDMGEIHSIQIYVTGQARQPGEYTVSALSTLVDAVFLSGGPSGAGSMRHVLLKREGKVITDFDLYALLVKGDKSGDAQLQSGDVLYIPAAGPQAALLGSVRVAAIYELRGQQPVEELLNMGGGRTTVSSGGRISVERIEDHAQRHAFTLASDATSLQSLLADGDIVRIDPIVSSYREAVTLRGSLANPGHFLWHAGMRLSELLPDRDALVTRDYWWRRTQLGLPAPELAAPSSREEPTEKPAAVSSPGAQTDWNFAVVERLDPATMSTSLLPFNLGKLVLDRDASQDLELKPGDVVTIFSQEDVHPPIDEQTKYVHLEGEFVHAGVYSVSAGETLRSLVARAGGFTGNAYLYGSEFTRKSTQALEELRLKEFADRIEHQLLRASIKMDSASEVGGLANGGAQTARQGTQVSSVNRELIERLRRLQPTGRIVLDLKPHSTGESELPEMPLEDGDTLLVPSRPATVQVIGAVFDQNAFLYRGGARADNYLHLAGGMNRDADHRQVFVLRADGSVSGRGAGQSVLTSDFGNLRLNPGDTIVVPEKNIGAGAMRQFMAWTEIFSQFALGAAAVNILK
ncbi:MAG: SLBB domain-containing protein [Terracidiphilus sp.]